jgi:hypothetical protein
MEERMARRRDRPRRLDLRETFETGRLGPQCLIQAYARLVPIQRKRVTAKSGNREQADAAVRGGGGEHG